MDETVPRAFSADAWKMYSDQTWGPDIRACLLTEALREAALSADMDRNNPRHAHEAMALANAALPNSDRRKITADDAEWLRLLAGNHTIDFALFPAWARAFHAKIAAILPPAGEAPGG